MRSVNNRSRNDQLYNKTSNHKFFFIANFSMDVSFTIQEHIFVYTNDCGHVTNSRTQPTMTGTILELGPLCPMRLPLLKSIPDVICCSFMIKWHNCKTLHLMQPFYIVFRMFYSLSSNSMDGTMGFVIHTYTIPHFGWTNAIVEVMNRCRTEDEQTVRIAFSERKNSSNCVL